MATMLDAEKLIDAGYPSIIDATRLLKPEGLALLAKGPAIHYFRKRGAPTAWAVDVGSVKDADRVGKKIFKSLVSKRALTAADPFMHDLPLYVVHSGGVHIITPKSRSGASVGSDDEPHDPREGVLYDWQYDALQNKSAWKGYFYRLSEWSWNAATYEDSDEPDSWGDDKTHGPYKTLDEIVAIMARSPFKWEKWFSHEEFQSVVKKTKKTVTQGIATISRVDNRPLGYEERKHIERALKMKERR